MLFAAIVWAGACTSNQGTNEQTVAGSDSLAVAAPDTAMVAPAIEPPTVVKAEPEPETALPTTQAETRADVAPSKELPAKAFPKTKINLKKNPLNADWWAKLDEEWKTVFRKAAKFSGEPAPANFDSIFVMPELNAVKIKSTALEGLQPLIHLQRLNLMGSEVADVAVLGGLVALEKLNLTYSKVPKEKMDEFRQKYPKVQVLPMLDESWWKSVDKEWKKMLMAAAGLKTAPDLAGLQKIFLLEKIVADKKVVNAFFIKTLAPLEQLKNIRHLNLNNSQITDLAILQQLPKLEAVYLQGTKISDISALAQLPNLQELDISMTQVNTLEPLKGLKMLRKLNCYGTKITSLDPLKNLVNLTELNAFDLQINTLAPLQKLDNLQILQVSGTGISDVAPLAGLRRLKVLNVSETQVTKLDPLKNLVFLRELSFANTQVASLDVAKNMSNLTALKFAHTKVSSLDPISEHDQLTAIDLSHTQVSDLGPLINKAGLTAIWINGSEVKSIGPLLGLKLITTLDCAKMPIPAAELSKFRSSHPEAEVVQ